MRKKKIERQVGMFSLEMCNNWEWKSIVVGRRQINILNRWSEYCPTRMVNAPLRQYLGIDGQIILFVFSPYKQINWILHYVCLYLHPIESHVPHISICVVAFLFERWSITHWVYLSYEQGYERGEEETIYFRIMRKSNINIFTTYSTLCSVHRHTQTHSLALSHVYYIHCEIVRWLWKQCMLPSHTQPINDPYVSIANNMCSYTWYIGANTCEYIIFFYRQTQMISTMLLYYLNAIHFQ